MSAQADSRTRPSTQQACCCRVAKLDKPLFASTLQGCALFLQPQGMQCRSCSRSKQHASQADANSPHRQQTFLIRCQQGARKAVSALTEVKADKRHRRNKLQQSCNSTPKPAKPHACTRQPAKREPHLSLYTSVTRGVTRGKKVTLTHPLTVCVAVGSWNLDRWRRRRAKHARPRSTTIFKQLVAPLCEVYDQPKAANKKLLGTWIEGVYQPSPSTLTLLSVGREKNALLLRESTPPL